MEKNGAPLSIEEHHKVLAQIKAEAKEAHGEMLKATSRSKSKDSLSSMVLQILCFMLKLMKPVCREATM